MNGKIYKHTSPSGKVYVGQTTQPLNTRWRRDGVGYKQCSAFYRAIIKYGWENFTHELIEDGINTQIELDAKESYYIKLYNSLAPNGYNISYGGHNNSGQSTRIVSFGWDGHVNANYESMQRAADMCGVDRSSISIAVKHRSMCCKNFWCKESDYSTELANEIIEEYDGKFFESLYQYKYDTHELLNVFHSIQDAASKSGVSSRAIRAMISQKKKSAGGFIWSFTPISDFSEYVKLTNAKQLGDIYIYYMSHLIGVAHSYPDIAKLTGINIISDTTIKKMTNTYPAVYSNGYVVSIKPLTDEQIDNTPCAGCHMIYQYSLDGILINRFRAFKFACDFLNIPHKKYSGMYTALKDFKRTYHGYRWSYVAMNKETTSSLLADQYITSRKMSNKTSNKISRKMNPVDKYTLNGDFVCTYATRREAANKNGVRTQDISKAIKTHTHCRGFIYVNHGDNDIQWHHRGFTQMKSVCAFTRDWKYIGEYCSEAEAARQLGVFQANIHKCLRGEYKTTGRMHFKYASDCHTKELNQGDLVA